MREVIDKFVTALSNRDSDSLKDIFSENVSFRDLNGFESAGNSELINVLNEYFGMFPDYSVQILDVEEMMGSFKIFVQTYGNLSDEIIKDMTNQEADIPTPEQLHPPALWKIGFENGKINLWNMMTIMGSKDAKNTALSFVWAFNSLNTENIISLMTDSFTTVGITGISETKDKKDWKSSIEDYYKIFPDYRIFPENIHVRGNLVIILGRSDGTMSDYVKKTLKKKDGTPVNKDDLQGTAIWTALVENGLVKEWSINLYNQKSLEELELVEYGYKA